MKGAVAFLVVFLFAMSLGGHSITDDEYTDALCKASKIRITREEITRLHTLKPLVDYPNIMFWRPQKVGSSTILSLLISFGFRNNILIRRKTPGYNYMCRKIALCAYETLQSNHLNTTKQGTD